MVEMAVSQSITALVVRDVEAVLDFYQNCLGMEVGWTEPMDEGGTKYYLRFKHGILKLFAPDDKPEKNTRSFLGLTGYRLLTFVLTNMTDICKELEEKGVRFLVPVQTNDDGSKWAILADPEGNYIELAGRG